MFFVFTETSEPTEEHSIRSLGLIRIKINDAQLALVSFRTQELGKAYFNPAGLSEASGLISEAELQPPVRESLIGEPVLEFQDEKMMEEIRRRGAGFPFCEFVTEYSF